MVVGSGMLANAFEVYRNNQDVVIYASGVSNSKELDKEVFIREKKLLLDTINNNRNSLIIYFSTCSILDSSVNKSKYVLHKLEMEKIIKEKCNQFYIFRLPQVVGNTNSPTLINFLFSSIINNTKININKNSTRNLIYVDDLFRLIDFIIINKLNINSTINIATPFNTFIIDIVSIIEDILNKKANINLVNFGKIQDINICEIKDLDIFKSIFKSNYIVKILNQYYKMKYENLK